MKQIIITIHDDGPTTFKMKLEGKFQSWEIIGIMETVKKRIEFYDAFALAEKLGWDWFYVVGHCMGGMVAQRMVADIGAKAELATIPDVGHAPALDEPESIAAIDRLLARVLHG